MLYINKKSNNNIDLQNIIIKMITHNNIDLYN